MDIWGQSKNSVSFLIGTICFQSFYSDPKYQAVIQHRENAALHKFLLG